MIAQHLRPLHSVVPYEIVARAFRARHLYGGTGGPRPRLATRPAAAGKRVTCVAKTLYDQGDQDHLHIYAMNRSTHRWAEVDVCFDVSGNGGGRAASTTMTCPAKAALVDNTDTFSLTDAELPTPNSVSFYFDVNGAGGGTGTAIDVSGATTAAEVAALVVAAIEASALEITPIDGEDGTIELTQNTAGTQGDGCVTEAVADAGFLLPAFASGTTETGTACDISGATTAANVAAALASTLGTLLNNATYACTVAGASDAVTVTPTDELSMVVDKGTIQPGSLRQSADRMVRVGNQWLEVGPYTGKRA